MPRFEKILVCTTTSSSSSSHMLFRHQFLEFKGAISSEFHEIKTIKTIYPRGNGPTQELYSSSRRTAVVNLFKTIAVLKDVSGVEVVTSPPLKRKVRGTRPTIIRARCMMVRQHYSAKKIIQKCMNFLAGAQQRFFIRSWTARILVILFVDKSSWIAILMNAVLNRSVLFNSWRWKLDQN